MPISTTVQHHKHVRELDASSMSLSDEREHLPKRRKVRKGTSSCWECKKRKVRCIIQRHDICENCRRRSTVCISQDLPDQINILTPSVSEDDALLTDALQSVPEEAITRTGSNFSSQHQLDRALRSAWPAKVDVEQMMDLKVGLSVHFHAEMCNFYNNNQAQISKSEIFEPPPSGSHPVLIARKLLILGNHLQGVVLPDRSSNGLREKYYEIMHRAVNTATRLVTKNEDLIDSIEGLECVMLEIAYQNYAGNLQQAWMATRRGITIVQAMGLHRRHTLSTLKCHDPMTRLSFDATQAQFRLVQVECYLGLVLGLPRSSLEAPNHILEILTSYPPVIRLQHTHLFVADRILKRSHPSVAETGELDSLLETAAAVLTPKWWLMPDLRASNDDDGDNIVKTSRLMDQFSHYHLLIRLHLPYLMRSTSDKTHDYSKTTAVYASRETLNRYLSFRVDNPAHYYCRGTDFLAFIAATVLALAHIECSRLSKLHVPDTYNAFGLLTHCRMSDRGILERTLEVLREVSKTSADAIASKIVYLLEQLLTIDASRVKRVVQASDEGDQNVPYHSETTNDCLRLYIPAFGYINFGVEAAEPIRTDQHQVPDDHASHSHDLSSLTTNVGFEGEWDMQGIDLALFEGLFGESNMEPVLNVQSWL
ncbi:hypothetical protein AUEXF2481DRAFT_518744 [Aureobasidium subglaciale EXF-2481]|uniref:Zn(2)-C6 fungal-type domain-containing protein n=1 Tax=Aureobasidium subglaciale (strain EXF-2481) TaxID=1043005 RepID=A0A074YVR1_AURSE|nr:uncharacterized protein AUEXF2481DRAFT_518744 [Aureobasidium subglaciale EXF-2481]KAI5212995.1 hypothetical protein E4T38_00299 [Aureobasidium subglaciale]KAI5232491.1 hypothetical protein E4T40_00298 [Aureobasidium subglaciale]KAI5234656.1 hypothetical protein E4T41_00298 [Aureobasidium subglaciale]KAI5268474.1 hypothetical protein E4T46_00298 [Aureobasidium subglaciale]KEQ90966.1 hypothetical protein AUEXF2481DRAFT_518744 [Aureobasidium subglaciale EXF-2481]